MTWSCRPLRNAILRTSVRWVRARFAPQATRAACGRGTLADTKSELLRLRLRLGKGSRMPPHVVTLRKLDFLYREWVFVWATKGVRECGTFGNTYKGGLAEPRFSSEIRSHFLDFILSSAS